MQLFNNIISIYAFKISGENITAKYAICVYNVYIKQSGSRDDGIN